MEEKKIILNGVTGLLICSLLGNVRTTKTRCNVFKEQLHKANEKIVKGDISNKEKRYYKKEKRKAFSKLNKVDLENKAFIVSVVFAVCFSSVAFITAVNAINNE